MNEELLDVRCSFIEQCLRRQERLEDLEPWRHKRLIQLLDMGLVGMDGFKYCWPAEAKDAWRVCHGQTTNQRL